MLARKSHFGRHTDDDPRHWGQFEFVDFWWSNLETVLMGQGDQCPKHEKPWRGVWNHDVKEQNKQTNRCRIMSSHTYIHRGELQKRWMTSGEINNKQIGFSLDSSCVSIPPVGSNLFLSSGFARSESTIREQSGFFCDIWVFVSWRDWSLHVYNITCERLAPSFLHCSYPRSKKAKEPKHDQSCRSLPFYVSTPIQSIHPRRDWPKNGGRFCMFLSSPVIPVVVIANIQHSFKHLVKISS